MKLKAYHCSHCNEEKIIDAEKNTPECCGETMQQIPLDDCSKPYNPESARLDEADDACDDGVN
jgi:hypothetical protein